jgi:hypothetical protein
MKKTFLILTLAFQSGCMRSIAQQNIFTAGFQFRPIFPSELFKTGANTLTQNGITFSIAQKPGYNAGMIIRRGLTKQLSFETAINYTKRNFSLSISDTLFTGKSNFTIIGYEIPLQGMIFLRVAEKLYMTTSLGLSMDMYATNITTHDSYFRHYSRYHSIFQFGALASLGFEYRTAKSGYFYFGSSYHQPFSYFFSSTILYQPKQEIASVELAGNFISIDFRYYFHEAPMKPKKKVAKEVKKRI